MKTEYIQIRITPVLKEAAKQRATELGLEVSEYIRNLVEYDIKAYSFSRLDTPRISLPKESATDRE